MKLPDSLSQGNSDSFSEYVTTSEAAEICKVTRFTIRNWILSHKLKAYKTAGQHSRILRSDLQKFMKDSGLNMPAHHESGSLKKAFMPCWDYFQAKNDRGHDCRHCLVLKTKANRCFLTVRSFGAQQVCCQINCAECAYMEIYFPDEKNVCSKARFNGAKPDRSKKNVKNVDDFLNKNIVFKGIYKTGRFFAAVKSTLTDIARQAKTKFRYQKSNNH